MVVVLAFSSFDTQSWRWVITLLRGGLFSLSIKLLFFSRELLDVFGTLLFCHCIHYHLFGDAVGMKGVWQSPRWNCAGSLKDVSVGIASLSLTILLTLVYNFGFFSPLVFL